MTTKFLAKYEHGYVRMIRATSATEAERIARRYATYGTGRLSYIEEVGI